MDGQKRCEQHIATTSTTRLRKLECDAGCGYIARVSRTAMLRGLPGCPCGGTLWPTTIADAESCVASGVLAREQLLDHPESVAFNAYMASAAHGQAWSGAGTNCRTTDHLRSFDEIAFERLVSERIECATRSRLDALKLNAAAVAADDIPF